VPRYEARPKPIDAAYRGVNKEWRLTHLEERVVIFVLLQFSFFSLAVIFVFSRASLVLYAACLMESPEL
jgi:hypothetical protein